MLVREVGRRKKRKKEEKKKELERKRRRRAEDLERIVVTWRETLVRPRVGGSTRRRLALPQHLSGRGQGGTAQFHPHTCVERREASLITCAKATQTRRSEQRPPLIRGRQSRITSGGGRGGGAWFVTSNVSVH